MKSIWWLSLGLLVLISCKHWPEETSVKSGLKKINGTQLYYKTIGQGAPILVIHGGPGLNHNYLYANLKPLSKNYQLIFYDQRACGQSSTKVDTASITLDNFIEDIEGLRKAFGLKKLILMAHSWGGILAMKYAIKYPDKVKALILVDATAASSKLNAQANQILAGRFTVEDSIERANIIKTHGFQKREPEAIEKLMKIGFKHEFYDTTFIDSLHLSLNKNFAETNRLLQYLAKDLTSYDLHPELQKIKSPTLLIYGDDDPLLELAGKNIHQSIVGSELEIIAHSGHFPFIEKPDAFNDLVNSFIENNN